MLALLFSFAVILEWEKKEYRMWQILWYCVFCEGGIWNHIPMTSKLYIVKYDTLVLRFYHISHLHIAQ